MKRLLVMEGSDAAARERAARQGQDSTGGIYVRALLAEDPSLTIDILNGADAGAMPPVPLTRYDGFVISGSALHAYDETAAVAWQIDWVRRVAATGMPILGSCWGLQICAVAGGGVVQRNSDGAEMGIARKIVPTAAGRAHPMLAGRAASFDAPCIHYDDVARLPEGSVILASNSHCSVQAAVMPLGRSLAWGVQYHPEFDLPHLAALYEGYGDNMVGTAFFQDRADLDRHVADLRSLAQGDERSPLAWRMGIDADLLDGPTRRTELRNWLRQAGG